MNSVTIVNSAKKLKMLPRFVPSIKSTGTLRYMSRLAAILLVLELEEDILYCPRSTITRYESDV